MTPNILDTQELYQRILDKKECFNRHIQRYTTTFLGELSCKGQGSAEGSDGNQSAVDGEAPPNLTVNGKQSDGSHLLDGDHMATVRDSLQTTRLARINKLRTTYNELLDNVNERVNGLEDRKSICARVSSILEQHLCS